MQGVDQKEILQGQPNPKKTKVIPITEERPHSKRNLLPTLRRMEAYYKKLWRNQDGISTDQNKRL